MNKKLLCVCTLSLLLTGCGNLATSNVAEGETVTIDATEKIDPSIYLKNVDKDATINYEIKNNEMAITVTKGDKTENINIPVQVNEPKVSIDRHIEVDKYVGYDLEQYIHEDEGVTHTTNFDEDTGKLSVTFTKGEWSTTLEDDVTVLDSNPINNWPKVYTCCDSLDNGCNDVIILNEDKSFIHKDVVTGWQGDGTFNYDNNGTWSLTDNDQWARTLYYKGTWESFVADSGPTQNGTPTHVSCSLNK